MSEQPFDLNRENNIEALVDALGKKWEVHSNRQSGLCHASYKDAKENAVIPKEFAGKWTKPSLLITKMKGYVQKTWDNADKKQQRIEREALAEVEAERQEKADLAKKELLKEMLHKEAELKAAKSKPKVKAKNDAGSKK